MATAAASSRSTTERVSARGAVIRLRDRIRRATPTTITAPATSWIGVTASCRIKAPRNTATTGLTKAYVAISGRGAWRRTHAKAVKATRLPIAVRYTSAMSESPLTVSGRNEASSPDRTAAMPRTTAPASICIAVVWNGSCGRRARWAENSDPAAHAIGETTRAATPAGSRLRSIATPDPMRMATPTMPAPIPTIARPGSRSFRKIRPKTATHTGIIAIRTPAIPDGTVSSPQATAPMPPPISRAPTIEVSRISRIVGRVRWSLRKMATAASMTMPAIRNRTDAMTNGGIVSTATRIPRYVDPHTK